MYGNVTGIGQNKQDRTCNKPLAGYQITSRRGNRRDYYSTLKKYSTMNTRYHQLLIKWIVLVATLNAVRNIICYRYQRFEFLQHIFWLVKST